MLWGRGVLYRPRRRLTTVWSSLADRPLIVMAYIAATGVFFFCAEGGGEKREGRKMKEMSAATEADDRGAPQQTDALESARQKYVEAVVKQEKKDDMDRDRLLNDLTNTGVIAALLGGFALSCLSIDLSSYGADRNGTNDTVVLLGTVYWFIAFLAAHVCTLSAASSALLYRKVNLLPEEAAGPWLQQHRRLHAVPFLCFMIGIKLYEVSIVLFGLLYFHGRSGWQIISAALGLICCMGILVVAWMAR